MSETLIRPIAHVRTDFKEKFGIPRQSNRVKGAVGKIIFEPKYRTPDAIRGLEGFNYIWLVFDFSLSHKNEWSPTVRPPRLGGNTKMGVFATRSPFRPNPIGLSSVKIEKIEITSENGPEITVSGVDLLDGTPIFDIKPYLPFSDCHTDAIGGFSEEYSSHKLKVDFPERLKNNLDCDVDTLINCLAEDPRPSYVTDDGRIYGMRYANYNVRFTVKTDTLTVIEIEQV